MSTRPPATSMEAKIQKAKIKLGVPIVIRRAYISPASKKVASVVAFTASIMRDRFLASRCDWYWPLRDKMRCHTSKRVANTAKFDSFTRIERKPDRVTPPPSRRTSTMVASPKDRTMKVKFNTFRIPT